MKLGNKEIAIEGHVLRTARLADEGFVFLNDPGKTIGLLRESGRRVDLFTFTQPVSQESHRYPYPFIWDNVAALQITTFDNWWTKQIDGKTRNMARRGEKKGMVVREVPFDEALVNGIWEIYNECPVRQGRPFPHYGRTLEEVRDISATFLDCSIFVGAFIDEKLIGFIKMTTDERGSQAALMHIIAMIQHRDKSPNNALIAQAVRICANRGIPFLVYSKFAYGNKQRDSLSDFKESNGFKRVDLPQYYVPMTFLGRVAFQLGLYRGLKDRLPEPLLAKIRQLRLSWYARRTQTQAENT